MDRAHDGNLRLHGNLLHELHYFGRRRRVEARGWLVQKDDGWSLGERAREREAPLLAARQAAEEHVARLGVLTAGETSRLKQFVDRRLALGARERRAIETDCVAKMIPARQECPEGIVLRDDGAVLGVERGGERLSVERDCSEGLSFASFEGEHVEQRRLPRARGSHHREDAASTDVSRDGREQLALLGPHPEELSEKQWKWQQRFALLRDCKSVGALEECQLDRRRVHR
mmetsp:Transcript_24919/g.68322  ORF Transcript_24919/g.68322 Transcript_24919/m.68322 type:complete len:230 (-) Transcript_24919:162-851(-)